MTQIDDNGPLLLYSPYGYKCCECEAILSPNGAISHIRRKHPFLEENFVLQNRTKDVSKQPLVKVRAFCCQSCPMSYESLYQYKRHCERMGCPIGNIRNMMGRTGTGHLIPLQEESPSNRKRPSTRSESPIASRKNKLPRNTIENTGIRDAVSVQNPLHSPRKSNNPKEPPTHAVSPETAGVAEGVNRQLQSPRATRTTKLPLRKLSIPTVTPTGSPTHDRKLQSSSIVTSATGSPTTRQLLASLTDTSSAGEDDPANRQLQSPRATSQTSSSRDVVAVHSTGLDDRHPPAVTIPNPPSAPENCVVDQPTPSTKKQLLATSVPKVVAVEGKYVHSQENPKSMQAVLDKPLEHQPETLSQLPQPASSPSAVDENSTQKRQCEQPSQGGVTAQELQSPTRIPLSDSPTPLDENLSDVVGLRQVIKIYAPDDEMANIITPWVSDIFLGKSTDQISSWIREQHEVLRKPSLTPATLDKTTRWIQDCANVDALMVPGDFHTILSSMNPRDPSDMSDETLHKMPRDESGLYTELRSLVSFLSPNTDLSLYEVITLLCRELLESPATMNFASHRLFQYIAARIFADENTLRDVSVMDQIASNLLHLFRLAASSYVRRYLFSDYNIFTKQNINTSSISEGSAEFGRLVRKSVFVQFLVPFLHRLREYQGFGNQTTIMGKQGLFVDTIII